MNEVSMTSSMLAQAQALHARLPVTAAYFEQYGHASLYLEEGGRFCDLAQMDAAHVCCMGVAMANGSAGYFAVGPGGQMEVAGDRDWAYERLLTLFDAAMDQARQCPRVRFVAGRADLDAVGSDQQIHVLPLVTGHAWMRDLQAIDTLYARGLRISHLASASCLHFLRPMPSVLIRGREGPVLSESGRAAIARMNELGMVIDCAHASDVSMAAIVEASTRPVVDGHTGSTTLVPHCRGHNDATLRLIADRGGVVGIHFADHLFAPQVWGPKYPIHAEEPWTPLWEYNLHLLASQPDPETRMQLRKDRAAQHAFFASRNFTPTPAPSGRLASVQHMADHIEHLVNVMGEDHVGLGGDVNGIADHQWPLGMDNVGALPALTACLLARGWGEKRLEKFLSGNWLRVWREVLR